MMSIEMYGLTHPGRVRPHNEDAFAVDPERGLAVLADGMGGHQAGEVASELAVGTVVEELATAGDDPPAALVEAVMEANRRILATADARPECRGMGATLVALWCRNGRFYATHLGDSRLYRLRGGVLEQLTEDHSLVQEMVRSGMLSEEEAMASFNKNLITQALGIELEIRPRVREGALQAGDLFLLCSDGLSDFVGDAQIAQTLTEDADLSAAATRLVDLANDAGGPDNITVVLVRSGDPSGTGA